MVPNVSKCFPEFRADSKSCNFFCVFPVCLNRLGLDLKLFFLYLLRDADNTADDKRKSDSSL